MRPPPTPAPATACADPRSRKASAPAPRNARRSSDGARHQRYAVIPSAGRYFSPIGAGIDSKLSHGRLNAVRDIYMPEADFRSERRILGRTDGYESPGTGARP